MKRISKIKFNDPLILWAISGIIGAYTRDIWSFFSKQIGFAKFYIWQVGAALLLEKEQVMTVGGNLVGLLVDAIVGSMLGVLAGLFLKWRGKSYYILKGFGIGVMAWLLMYGLLFHNLPFTKESAPKDVLSNLSAFIGHAIFGIATVIAYVKWLAKYEVKDEAKTLNETNTENKANTVIYVMNAENVRTSLFQTIKSRFVKKAK